MGARAGRIRRCTLTEATASLPVRETKKAAAGVFRDENSSVAGSQRLRPIALPPLPFVLGLAVIPPILLLFRFVFFDHIISRLKSPAAKGIDLPRAADSAPTHERPSVLRTSARWQPCPLR